MLRSSLIYSLRCLAPVLFLSACVSVQTYVEPTNGERAKVRFVTTSRDITVLRACTDENCGGENEWLRIKNGTLNNNPPKSLDIPLNVYNPNAVREVYVAANKPVTALFFGGDERYSCGALINFTFAEGKSYEVKYDITARTCGATVSEVQNQAGQWSLVQLAAFTNRTKNNAGCMERFKAMRWF